MIYRQFFILFFAYVTQISGAELDQRACVSFHVGKDYFKAFATKMVDQYLVFWNDGVDFPEFNFQKPVPPYPE